MFFHLINTTTVRQLGEKVGGGRLPFFHRQLEARALHDFVVAIGFAHPSRTSMGGRCGRLRDFAEPMPGLHDTRAQRVAGSSNRRTLFGSSDH